MRIGLGQRLRLDGGDARLGVNETAGECRLGGGALGVDVGDFVIVINADKVASIVVTKPDNSTKTISPTLSSANGSFALDETAPAVHPKGLAATYVTTPTDGSKLGPVSFGSKTATFWRDTEMRRQLRSQRDEES